MKDTDKVFEEVLEYLRSKVIERAKAEGWSHPETAKTLMDLPDRVTKLLNKVEKKGKGK